MSEPLSEKLPEAFATIPPHQEKATETVLGNGQPAPAPLSTATTPPIPEKSYGLRVFRALRRIIRAIELHSRQLVNDYQITGPQLVCLLALQAEAPLSMKELAQSAYLSPSTVVGIVDRLEEKGLAQRIRSTTDRRAVKITVTEKGQQLLANAPSPMQATLAQALQNLPESERIAIACALERIVDLIEAEDIDAAPVLQSSVLHDDAEQFR